ncbi:hypothetical protein POVWA2_004260 [Plasmodium ovale wallikeri]|uniref:Uncharacterized protein n=1 Tax=Plasmodium ovale wallikeri TaxID=864142 RepID=A0A1A8YIU3_PLAOA|nr:hypothetical protein POVWA2_004260 [Plasmodium ovale wallikeri]
MCVHEHIYIHDACDHRAMCQLLPTTNAGFKEHRPVQFKEERHGLYRQARSNNDFEVIGVLYESTDSARLHWTAMCPSASHFVQTRVLPSDNCTFSLFQKIGETISTRMLKRLLCEHGNKFSESEFKKFLTDVPVMRIFFF